ncbi:DUF4019 domain-containing protein [Massilia sp. MS-15]|uniref:DUF4019 domain-containing protein n=1 Tax=Massilia sp. MS-15 TaxID=2878200 RepID=UPI001CD55482|nr:DUF4019 domain-containing protein [Massilia sp. MS-15]MCA1248022.1 DUF4019 domain-containing protein [Massilia sp. MS-15]
MKFAAVLLSVAAVIQPAGAQEPAGAVQAASAAAATWLAMADEGKYADSWSQGASELRAAVSQEQWNAALRSARTPLGAVKSRKLASSRYTRSLPGAPDGHYVVLQYQTEFKARSSIETVIPMREADGSWKVSGYFIQ